MKAFDEDLFFVFFSSRESIFITFFSNSNINFALQRDKLNDLKKNIFAQLSFKRHILIVFSYFKTFKSFQSAYIEKL